MNRHEEIERTLTSRPVPDGIPSTAVLPDYDGFSIAGVPPLIKRALGEGTEETPLIDVVAPPMVDRVIFILLDGLGYRALRRLADTGAIPTLSALASAGSFLPITSVFPSTTVSALTTLATGKPPLSHGMLGYRLYLREASAIINMIRLSVVGSTQAGSAFDAGLVPESLLTGPTSYEQLKAGRVVSHVLLPRQIARSGLSTILYRGCENVHPVAGFDDMCVTARQILDRDESRTFVTLYWPGLDAVAHVRGPETDAYIAEARSIDHTLRHELVDRVDRTLLVLTSDHGFVPMEPSDYKRLSSFDGLEDASLLPPVGEPRASYLFLRQGANLASAAEGPELLDGDLLRLTADQAIALGLFGNGEIHPETRHRIGDLVLASTGRAGILHPYPDTIPLRGMHGGLTEDEMLVPLIATAL